MTERSVPRLLLAGTNSGCGKTTITCGLLRLLHRRGADPAAFKCGPDYIDPAFHTAVLGVESANLDPFFTDSSTMRALLAQNAAGHGLALIEGVMGYYDGTGDSGLENSTWQTARALSAPAVLLVNGRGAALSALAVLRGFLDFVPHSMIRGVIFNQVTPGTYALLKRQLEQQLPGRVAALGYVPKLPPDCVLESRHLGLVTPAEIPDLCEKLDRVADVLEETLDLPALLTLAQTADPITDALPPLPRLGRGRLAVARDTAFCFYYKDNLRLLETLGAELCFFSPLENQPLPPDCCGLLLGGGYPELFGETLSRGTATLDSIRAAHAQGMPILAECGGFLYLSASLEGRPMAGVLPGAGSNQGRLTRFGYVTLTGAADGLFGPAGTAIRGHEFHYFDSTCNGEAFTARKTSGKCYPCGHSTPRLYAGFPHLYFWSNPAAAVHFYQTCLTYQKARSLSC